jgi:hypothetical protein
VEDAPVERLPLIVAPPPDAGSFEGIDEGDTVDRPHAAPTNATAMRIRRAL